jgi:hypothetical protein
MRVSGVALFTGVAAVPPPPSTEPPTPSTLRPFQAMYAINGQALFRGALAGGIITPPDPGGYQPKAFEEQMDWRFHLSYEAGESNVYNDDLMVAVSLSFGSEAQLEMFEELRSQLLLSYDSPPQVSITLEVSESVNLYFTAKARIRGWNDDKELPSTDWTPDPKPNLF